MSRFAALVAVLPAACQQASPLADNRATNFAANVTANATEAGPPFAETPGAHPAAPEPGPIPARFRGAWADSEPACADPKHHSRLVISGRTVRHPDFVIAGDSVTASGDQFSLKGHFEGTGRRAEAQYFINQAGTLLTDGGGGGAVRVRCG